MKFSELIQLLESEEEPIHITTYWDDGKTKRAEYWKDRNKENHRLDGPAKIMYYSSGNLSLVVWYKHGKRHRLDGPALIDYDEDGKTIYIQEYWINGRRYTKEEYDAFLKNVKPEDVDMLSDLGQSFD